MYFLIDIVLDSQISRASLSADEVIGNGDAAWSGAIQLSEEILKGLILDLTSSMIQILLFRSRASEDV